MAEITIRISERMQKIAGLFLGGIILASAFLFIRASGLFAPKYRLRVYAPEVAGLAAGAPVRIDGIDVGTVSEIRLAEMPASPERRIQLVLHIDERYQDAIRSDSTASLTTEGLLGNRYVSIRLGTSGTVINPGGEIPAAPSQRVTITDILKSIAKNVDCAQAEKSSTEDKNKMPESSQPRR